MTWIWISWFNKGEGMKKWRGSIIFLFCFVLFLFEWYYHLKTEHWRIDAFELWCWKRLLTVLWTIRRSNQSILKEISPGCSLVGLMLKLKLQYFGHLMWRADSFEKTLMLGKIEGRRRGDDRGWDGWMASPTQWTWVWVNSGSWWWTGRPGVLRFMGSQRVRHNWTTKLTDWLTIWMAFCFVWMVLPWKYHCGRHNLSPK